MSSAFKVGQKYSLEKIIEGFKFSGNSIPVVCEQNGKIKFVKFKSDMNPRWKTKSELWIHSGDRRSTATVKLVSSNEFFPLFCKHVNQWEFLGVGKFTITRSGQSAQEYSKDPRVDHILKFELVKEDVLAVGFQKTNVPAKTLLRKKSA